MSPLISFLRDLLLMSVFGVADNRKQHLFNGSLMEQQRSFMRSLGKRLPLFSPGAAGLKLRIPELLSLRRSHQLDCSSEPAPLFRGTGWIRQIVTGFLVELQWWHWSLKQMKSVGILPQPSVTGVLARRARGELYVWSVSWLHSKKGRKFVPCRLASFIFYKNRIYNTK